MTHADDHIQPPAPEPGPADRRSFLRAAAGGATVLAAGGAAGAADGQPAPKANVKLTGAVAARFDPKREVKLKDLHAVLDQILKQHGCPACGLLGLDIRLFRGDPVEPIRGFPEIVDVSLQRPA